MIRRTLLVLALVLAAVAAEARVVTVVWDANPPAEEVTGYIVYYGTVARTAPGFTAYDGSLDVGNVTTGAVDLPDPTATYYLAVVAYNASGLRSAYSQEISTGGTPPAATFLVTASATTGGAVSPVGHVSVERAASQTFTIAPQAGYVLSDVLVDGASVGRVASYTFSNVTASHAIEAKFERALSPPVVSTHPLLIALPTGERAEWYPETRTWVLVYPSGRRVTVEPLSSGR